MDEPLVVVTGAGASAELGRNGPVAQMPGWASALCEQLSPYVEVLGLRPFMEAQEFEGRIGAFLRFARSLEHLEPYLALGATNTEPTVDQDQWLRQARRSSEEIQVAIFETLHSLFRSDEINEVVAQRAYGSLFALLDNPRRFSVATTNYDPSAEIGLAEMGVRPYSGIDNSLRRGRPQVVHVDDLAHDDLRRTPVIYLHGRVGWYTDQSGQLLAADPDHPFNSDNGTPALLLPDPEKVYEESNMIRIWDAFRVLLQQAQRVLVLGHSLNDNRLVEELRCVPDERLAITVFRRDRDHEITSDTDQLLDRLRRKPHVIPMKFGPTIHYDPVRLEQFMEGSVPSHASTDAWVETSTDFFRQLPGGALARLPDQ